ncbi:MAG: hypothetical protein PUA88_03520 [Bacillales bacterium]|nr:hypothetical protein [Bacillales bacterium]
MGDRSKLIEDYNEMIDVLDNTKELEDRIKYLSSKAADIIVLLRMILAAMMMIFLIKSLQLDIETYSRTDLNIKNEH